MALYGVAVKVLTQSVNRNLRRFPSDFMFQLSQSEWQLLKSQFVTSNRGGIRRARPYAFSAQGVAMLSSVLRSERAIQVNVAIVRAFVRLRKLLSANDELRGKLAALERKYDAQFRVVFDAIRELMEPPPAAKKGRIGFVSA